MSLPENMPLTRTVASSDIETVEQGHEDPNPRGLQGAHLQVSAHQGIWAVGM